jgi:membrane protease YdiL (CAAX protease family)
VVSKKFQSAHPLAWGLVVSALATLASYLLPPDLSSTGVALVFLGATYALALPVGAAHPPAHYGLSLGGLMEAERVSFVHLIRSAAIALGQGTAVAALVLPPFLFGFLYWYAPEADFSFSKGLAGSPDGHLLGEIALWHLLAVALPEEAFFRGYLQTALEDRGSPRVSLGRISFSLAIVTVSLLFAAGHFATIRDPARLAVFFPSLLFGAVRSATGGIGAAVVLHAECNLFSQFLAQGYGL